MSEPVLGVTDRAENARPSISAFQHCCPSTGRWITSRQTHNEENDKCWVGTKWSIKAGWHDSVWQGGCFTWSGHCLQRTGDALCSSSATIWLRPDWQEAHSPVEIRERAFQAEATKALWWEQAWRVEKPWRVVERGLAWCQQARGIVLDLSLPRSVNDKQVPSSLMVSFLFWKMVLMFATS